MAKFYKVWKDLEFWTFSFVLFCFVEFESCGIDKSKKYIHIICLHIWMGHLMIDSYQGDLWIPLFFLQD